MIKINKIELKNIITTLEKSVDKDSSVTTSHLLFDGKKLTTSNTEFSQSIKPLSIHGKTFTFNCNLMRLKKFLGKTKKTDNEVLFVSSVEQNMLQITCGKRSTTLPQFNIHKFGDDYPMAKVKYYGHNISIPSSIYDAIDTSNPKFELNGMLIDFKSSNIVSTDTRRMAISSILESDLDTPIIIPKLTLKGVSEIRDLTFDKSFASFKYTTLKGLDVEVLTKLIVGEFPEYQRIIPRQCEREVTFDTKEVIEELKGMGDIQFTIKNGSCEVNVLSYDQSNIKIKLDSCNYGYTDTMKFAVNSKFLVEALSKNDETFTIKYNKNSLPFTVKTSKSITIIIPIVV